MNLADALDEKIEFRLRNAPNFDFMLNQIFKQPWHLLPLRLKNRIKYDGQRTKKVRTSTGETDVQGCIVHQIRQSTKYVAPEGPQGLFRRLESDLKAIYQAPTLELF